MSDQAQKLRAKVNENKLSSLIDDIKNIKDVGEIYNKLLEQNNNSCSVLCFVSAKGGVGKTLCAYATAELLKEYGKRVSIIDMNKCYSDIALYYQNPILMKVHKKNLLENSCFDAEDLNDKEQYIFQLSAEIRSVEYQLIKIALYQSKLSNFDFVIIDTPVCGSELIDNIYPIVDRLIFVGAADFNSQYNIRELIKNISTADQKIMFDYFINFFNDKRVDIINQFCKSFAAAENFQLKTILNLRNDKMFELLENQGAISALRADTIKKSAIYTQIRRFIESEIIGIPIADRVKNFNNKSLINKITGLFR